MKISMNDRVRVILTKAGADIFNTHNMRYHEYFRPKQLSEGDEFNTQLWDLMIVFGPNVHMGMSQVPFLDNNIWIT